MLWLNGQLIEEDSARIDPRDRGLLLGDGVFETMLVRQGHIAFFEPHLLRLANAAHQLAIPLPFSTQGLGHACEDLLKASELDKVDRASLRLTLTRGPAPRGLALPDDPRPTVMITAAALGSPPASQRLIIGTARRNSFSPSARIKALPYLDNILAKEEARARDADDAILLDSQGYLACTTIASIFLWQKERLLTPSLKGPILPGITRAAIIELALALKIEVAEEEIAPSELTHADGLFLTNSLIGAVPVSQLEGWDMAIHPLTARLSAAYEALLLATER
ncbi:MAG: 2-keto-4-methylthiobutyrate aminotransferase [Rhizobiales bacterium]|nr:2-keto-4-methylthiobutyrate aminotransferase [Hyphomicrobiales bacterium]